MSIRGTYPMLSIFSQSRLKFLEFTSTRLLKFHQPPSCFCNYFNSRLKSGVSNAIDIARLNNERQQFKGKTALNYLWSLVFFISGCGFAAVPLFNAYCTATNLGGTLNIDLSREKAKKLLKKVPNYELVISFNADKNACLRWNFQPLQTDIKVYPGETVLAFYSAENPTDEPISGISTYNVVPYEVAKYFNKIQCFCFDEQRLNPHEKVDMPVFFYIDPDIVNDPNMINVNNITLSYTFFEAIEGLDLPWMSTLVDDVEDE